MHDLQTDQRVMSKPVNFTAIREETDTKDQGENMPQAHGQAPEDSALEEEPQDTL